MKPKQWFGEPQGQRWLFKEVTVNPQRDGGTYCRGDDWAEVVASEAARHLGLPAAQVELAEYGNKVGIISRSVANRRSALIHGNEVLSGRDPDYGSVVGQRHPGYTVAAVMAIMAEIEGPPDSYLTADDAFAGFLVLDAVIGNTDRHHQNWAVLRNNQGQVRLSPTFDHASSLGSILNDTERLERLIGADYRRTVGSFASRAGTPFADAGSPIDAAVIALKLVSSSQRDRWLEAASEMTESVRSVIEAIPPGRISQPCRDFCLTLVECNLQALVQAMES